MENLLDYIVLLIVIGISLIGSVAKRRKAQANRSEQRSVTHSDPWQEIGTDPDEVQPEPLRIPSPPVYIQPGTSRPEIAQKRPSLSQSTLTSALVGSTAHDDLESDILDVKYTGRTWFEEHINDFNAETAVVYSEILKPKFEE